MSHQIERLLDPLQFAYITKLNVEDDNIICNTWAPWTSRIVCQNTIHCFFVTIYTIQSQLMKKTLIDLGIGKRCVMPVHTFPYQLHVNDTGFCSPPVSITTGAPCHHGCIPCTLFPAEVITQTGTTSNMYTILLLSACYPTTKPTTNARISRCVIVWGQLS